MADQPLVSLVVLAFNQTDYIDETLAGMFAQTYPRVEYIFSDDGSTDGTFEKMSEAARRYSGSARIVVNRTPRNLGALGHYYDVAALCRGDYLIGAAGDDIPYPERAAKVVDAFAATGADAVVTDWDVIDQFGRVLRRGRDPIEPDPDPAHYFPGYEFRQIYGLSSAYRRSVFDLVPLPPERVMAEDLFFSLMLALEGRRIAWLDDATMQYRTHPASLTHLGEALGVREYERRGEQAAKATLQVLRLFEKAVLSRDPGPTVDLDRLREDMALMELRAGWIDAPLSRRLSAWRGMRRSAHRRWLAARLFGIAPLEFAKNIRRMIRRGG